MAFTIPNTTMSRNVASSIREDTQEITGADIEFQPVRVLLAQTVRHDGDNHIDGL